VVSWRSARHVRLLRPPRECLGHNITTLTLSGLSFQSSKLELPFVSSIWISFLFAAPWPLWRCDERGVPPHGARHRIRRNRPQDIHGRAGSVSKSSFHIKEFNKNTDCFRNNSLVLFNECFYDSSDVKSSNVGVVLPTIEWKENDKGSSYSSFFFVLFPMKLSGHDFLFFHSKPTLKNKLCFFEFFSSSFFFLSNFLLPSSSRQTKKKQQPSV